VHFRSLPQLVADADAHLTKAKGHGMEQLVAKLYKERSRKSLGDFNLTEHVKNFWDKADHSAAQVEINLVALDDQTRTARLDTCKRIADKLLSDLPRFDRHVATFGTLMPRFSGWTVQKVAIAPTLSPAQRSAIVAAGYIAPDLHDLTAGLLTRQEPA